MPRYVCSPRKYTSKGNNTMHILAAYLLGLAIALVFNALCFALYAVAHPVLAVYRFLRATATLLQIGFVIAAIILFVLWNKHEPIAWYAWAGVFGGGIALLLLRLFIINPFLDNAIAYGGVKNARRAAQFQQYQEAMFDQWQRQRHHDYERRRSRDTR